jgi:hypothetical protein
LDSADDETRRRAADILKEFESLGAQLRAARAEYRTRFQELSARLLLQTSTWRSLRIRKRKLAREISELQKHCNDLMEEFVRIETLRTQEQNTLMSRLSGLSPSEVRAKLEFIESVNKFNLNELAEGLTVRWQLLDKIEAEVERVEAFVQSLSPGESWLS